MWEVTSLAGELAGSSVHTSVTGHDLPGDYEFEGVQVPFLQSFWAG